jgi:hypothetical protein
VVLRTLLVIAVLGMINFLGSKFFERFHWSLKAQPGLSSRTLNLVHSLTNHFEVTLYYDRQAEIYPQIKALLNEYSAADKNITVRTVDYVRDPGAAELIKEKFQQRFPPDTDTNLVIFECGGQVRVVPGDKLTQYETKFMGMKPRSDNPQQRDMEFERKPISFNGEQAFSAILMSLANPQPVKAYYLTGNGEASLMDSGQFGMEKFAVALQQDYISLALLDWIGPTGVPADCNLLIIAAPKTALKPAELDQIAQYLREGGKLLVFFGANSQGHPTGLENLLRSWGVNVLDDIAQDMNYSSTSQGYDVVVDQFSRHPIVASLAQSQLQLYLPRPIGKLALGDAASAPQVDELMYTSPGGSLMGDHNAPHGRYPLACAVEQKPVAGMANPRGNTRIVAVGDATFLGNLMIDSGDNRDFLVAAANWLGDRPLLLEGIGPHPVTNFRLFITRHQERQLDWLLLGALPGGVLFLGWMVWLVRRK